MKTLIVILLLLVLGVVVGCNKSEVQARFFDENIGWVNSCPQCYGRGVLWDSIKTELIKNTPSSQRVYKRCSNGCPIPGYYTFRKRQFVVEKQADETYRIYELADIVKSELKPTDVIIDKMGPFLIVRRRDYE